MGTMTVAADSPARPVPTPAPMDAMMNQIHSMLLSSVDLIRMRHASRQVGLYLLAFSI